MKRRNILFILLQVAFITYFQPIQAADESSFAKISVIDDFQIPNIPFKDLNGEDVFLKEFLGKPVILNFWASWCVPCIKELPELIKISRKYEGKVQLLAVSQDFGGMKKILKFLKENNLEEITPYHDPRNKLMNKFKQSGLPVTFLVDKQGNVKFKIIGYIDSSDKKVNKLLQTLF